MSTRIPDDESEDPQAREIRRSGLYARSTVELRACNFHTIVAYYTK